jgi:hypothetical protein
MPSPANGRIDLRASTLAPTRGCSRIAGRDAPPVPLVSAHVAGKAIRVRWRFLAAPQACRPAAVLVTANSVDNLENVTAPPGAGDAIPVHTDRGEIALRMPAADQPPYEARISVYDRQGNRSAVTTVPVASRP